MESLFSLEVIVNYVKLNSLKHSHCLFPTVAFRLLDYPTIAINLLDNYEAKELKERLKINEPFESIEKLPCFVELLDTHGRYIFSKGKSCLFRSDLVELKAHLKHAPMYLMILDTFFEPYKLIGTALVPLTNLINQIYDETCDDVNDRSPSSNRIDAPCIKMTHGVFDIRNLMGDNIGHISCACRLTSFGVSLLPHIDMTTEAANKLREAKKKKQQQDIKQKFEKSTIEETYLYELKTNSKNSIESKMTDKENKPKNESVNALVQTLNIDYKDAQVQIIDSGPQNNVNRKDKATQSPLSIRKNSKEELEDKNKFNIKSEPTIMYQVKHVHDEFVFNYYCPPPLTFHNNKNEESKSNSPMDIIEHKNYYEKRIQYLNEIASQNKDFVENNIIEDDSNDECKKIIPIDLNKKNHDIEVQNENLLKNFNILNQTPLLKCLFEEIAKLNSAIEKATTISKTNNFEQINNEFNNDKINSNQIKTTKNLVGILRNKNKSKVDNKKSIQSKTNKFHREAILESVNRLSQPKSEIGTNKVNNQTQNLNKKLDYLNDFDEIPVRDQNDKRQQQSTFEVKKKKVLKYGLTNTHRMRVLASRPNKAQKIEKDHENLLNQVKNNLVEMSLNEKINDNTKKYNNSSTLDHTDRSIQKNLEKILFESTGSIISSNSFKLPNYDENNDVLRMTNASIGRNDSKLQTGQLSLLNKVEMESTIGTYDYDTLNNRFRNTVNHENENIFLRNKLTASMESSSSDNNDFYNKLIMNNIQQSQTKVVQFGDTYIQGYNVNTSENSNSDDHKTKSSIDNNKFNRKSISLDEDDNTTSTSKKSSRNIFLDQKNNQYDEDFHSSLDSSPSSSTKHSTTNLFFTKNNNSIDSDITKKSFSNSQQSPRAAMKREAKISEEDYDDFDEDEEYKNLDYLTNTSSNKINFNQSNNNNNQSELVNSSKISTHSYNMHSFEDDDDDDDDDEFFK